MTPHERNYAAGNRRVFDSPHPKAPQDFHLPDIRPGRALESNLDCAGVSLSTAILFAYGSYPVFLLNGVPLVPSFGDAFDEENPSQAVFARSQTAPIAAFVFAVGYSVVKVPEGENGYFPLHHYIERNFFDFYNQ